MKLRIPFLCAAALARMFSCAVAAEKPLDFSRDILPILSDACFQCHGPDEKAREAKLRLDTKEGAFRTLDGVSPFVPGKGAESEALIRVQSADRDEVMPPPKSNRQLAPEEKARLKRWVEEGAKWGEHWAFVAPKRPELPPVKAAEWPKNGVDHFVLARLEEEQLAPSSEASREKLLRRVTLDLTGLPPTIPEVDAFLADHAPDAYTKVVDRLLASPRFGERMVWEWLDAARYADTNGYQGDPTRAMWYWRDWAIKALNDNLPFDQFTVEQLAGDLVPNPAREQLIATGFHRNHMINGEGGRIPEESRVDYVQDRVETTGTVWMGLTLNCCRCHDHKFDPLKQSEYYQLSAFFNSIDESGGADGGGGLAKPIVNFPRPDQEKQIAELKVKEEALSKEGDQLEARLRAEQPKWESALLGAQPGRRRAEVQWHVLEPDEIFSDNGATLTKAEDGAVLVSGKNPAKDSFVVTSHSKLNGITGFKLEALPDSSLPNNGPGRADNGNFVLSEIKLQGSGKPVELAAVSADFEQGPDHRAHTSFDNQPETGWAVMPELGKLHTLIFEARSQVGSGGDTLLSFRLECRSGHVAHVLGKFRISASMDNPALLRPMPENIRTVLSTAAEARSDSQKKELADYYLNTHADLAAAKQKREEAKKAREQAEKAVPATMVMRERDKPRETFILVKGAYDKFADKVQHGVPAVLPQLPASAPANRLALAKWLVSSEHPLTARVTVNRYWQTFFGTGLVKTVDDFGLQGAKPSHPELLDWLATEFAGSGWDVKALHRLIVTSATYRQSSKVAAGMAERDSENRLLARGPRFRLPSWMLRDQALAVSGLYVEKVGGPPVKVYQPEGVWEDATFGQIKFTQDHGEALYRRSLYVFWRRIVGPTLFFDVANRQNCAVKPGQTNTPLHALTTLNDVTYTEAARTLAARMLKQGGSSDAARLEFAFRLCTSRPPGEKENELLSGALSRLRQHYGEHAEAAKKLITVGESKPEPSIAPAELAAHTALCSLLLNMDETLSKE